jgi:hypothetical protein
VTENPTTAPGRMTGRGSRQFHSELPPFVAIPKALVFDPNISCTAVVAWALVTEQAWRHSGDGTGDVELGFAELTAAMGVTEKALRGHLKQLVEAGWMETWRRGQGLPNGYRALLTPHGQNGQNDRSRGKKSPVLRARAPMGLEPYEVPDRSTANAVALPQPDTTQPPKAVRVEGRNLPFDALALHGNADPRSRTGEITAALKKIRGYVWSELTVEARQAVATSSDGAATFERIVAAEVADKAHTYRATMGGAWLTPTALAKWWFDMGKQGRTGLSDEALEWIHAT